MSGTQDLVVAGGVQNMSQVPIAYAFTAARELGQSDPFSSCEGWVSRFGDAPVNQFLSAVQQCDQLCESELCHL